MDSNTTYPTEANIVQGISLEKMAEDAEKILDEFSNDYERMAML